MLVTNPLAAAIPTTHSAGTIQPWLRLSPMAALAPPSSTPAPATSADSIRRPEGPVSASRDRSGDGFALAEGFCRISGGDSAIAVHIGRVWIRLEPLARVRATLRRGLELRPQRREPLLQDGLSGLLQQVQVEAQVVQGGEPCAEGLVNLEQVAKVGS